jgi:lycopene beta-cyclase
MKSENFDIILCGSGMAGLSLAYRALREGVWKNERILIIDRSPKDKNDRTWCFWQRESAESPFQDVIYRSWQNLSCFTNTGRQIVLNRGDFAYNMIRSIDFYRSVQEFLSTCPQVTFRYEEIISVSSQENGGLVETSAGSYRARYIFNSVYKKPELGSSEQYFLQHFKGITIRTDQFQTDPDKMYLMDFRTSQEHGTTFFYVLPINRKEIFIEYTIFSKSLLTKEEYDLKIRAYLKNVLKINEYEILESEFGYIPMTDFEFKRRSGNIINIGTAGGDTRGSSGYTFTNTQKTISKILTSFRKEGHPFSIKENISRKHKLLDATILKVLNNNVYQGHQIFSDLFDRVDGETVFRFLDAESTLRGDLKVMRSLQAKHFIGPFFNVLYNKFM